MTGTASRLTGLQALAVARLVQAVVAILVLVQMIWTGLEPSAELEGVLVLIAVTRAGTPLRSPLLVGLVPLMLGVATLVAWHRAYRTAG